MTRLQAFMRVVAVLVILVIVLVFALWRRGTVRVFLDDTVSYCISIDDGQCDPAQGNYEKKIKIGAHKVLLRREGYVDFMTDVSVGRGQAVEISPKFVFAPVLLDLDDRDFYRIPVALTTKNFYDDQWPVLTSDCRFLEVGTGSGILLGGLPEDMVSMNWSESGSWAIGQAMKGSQYQFFIYRVEDGSTEKLDVRVKSALPLPRRADKFVFFWREVGGDSALGLADIETGEFSEVSELPGMDSGILYPSPKGDVVLLQNTSAGNNRDFYLVDLDSGRRDKISSGNDAVAAKWSVDGGFIIMVQQNEDTTQRITLLDVAAGMYESLPFALDLTKTAWLSGDTGFLFIDSESGNLSRYDISTKQKQDLAVLPAILGDVFRTCATEKDFVMKVRDGGLKSVRFAE